jgi:hypothetical protein
MATPRTIAPLGLFTLDALQAGWYLAARVLPWALAYVLLGFAAAYLFFRAGLVYPGGVVFATAVIAAVGVFAKRSGAITSRWAESRWGHALPDDSLVWLSITWRAFFVGSVVMWPVAMLMLMGDAVVFPLVVMLVSVPVFLLATGHAMSKVAARQLADREPVRAATPPRVAVVPAVAAPRAPRVDAPPEPKLRCPQCSQIEVARGPVIGWQCGACDWRGPRPSDAT